MASQLVQPEPWTATSTSAGRTAARFCSESGVNVVCLERREGRMGQKGAAGQTGFHAQRKCGGEASGKAGKLQGRAEQDWDCRVCGSCTKPFAARVAPRWGCCGPGLPEAGMHAILPPALPALHPLEGAVLKLPALECIALIHKLLVIEQVADWALPVLNQNLNIWRQWWAGGGASRCVAGG